MFNNYCKYHNPSFLLNDLRKAKKKEVLFPVIGWVKMFSTLTRPHSRMCIRIYIFDFKKRTSKQIKQNKEKQD